MGLPVHELCHIVRRQPIDERDRVRPFDPDLAHVRNVKKPRGRSSSHVFFDYTCRVLHRHIPATKIDHLAAKLAVNFI